MSHDLYQKVNYVRILDNAINTIDRYTPSSYYHSIATQVGLLLDSLSEVDLQLKNYQITDSITRLGNSILKLRTKKELKEAWVNAFNLGIQHVIEDILYENKLMRPVYDSLYTKVKASKTLKTFSFSNDIAKFAESDIERANKEYEKLSNNYNLAKSLGLYDDLKTREALAAKYTPEERANFLYTLQYVSDVRNRAEASKTKYISSNYLDQRISVLSSDVADNHDATVKESIAKFLSRDVRYLSRMKGNEAIARNRTNEIAKELEKDVRSKQEDKKKKVDEKTKSLLLNRARNILLTEISLAYNIGKLSAFVSPYDQDTRFRWEVNWEVQSTKKGYQICPDCLQMNGRIYTARDILSAATRIDTGILNYNGAFRSKTDFKNPSLPGIPFHPSCMCRWVIIPKPPVAAVMVDRTSVSPPADSSIMPAVLGTTLLVGGLFLLSRSNAWKLLLTNADEAIENIPAAIPEKVPDVIPDIIPNYVPDVISDDIPVPGVRTPYSKPKPVVTSTEPILDTEKAVEESIDYLIETQPSEVVEEVKEVIKEGIEQATLDKTEVIERKPLKI